MKKKTLDHLKLTELKKITEEINYQIPGNKQFLVKSIRFEDHEDWLLRISALIEICLLALDNKNSFCSKNLRHKDKDQSLQLALEMVTELLPHDEMSRLQRMTIILNNSFEDNYYPENLKFLFKNDNQEK